MDFCKQLETASKKKGLPQPLVRDLSCFWQHYREAIEMNHADKDKIFEQLLFYIDLVAEQQKDPYHFPLFHRKIKAPFDYATFGLELIRPFLVMEDSKVFGFEALDQMVAQLKKRENVILFANHQTEPDPQILSLLLEKTHPLLSEEMIFIAGHRVTQDPIAIPFSMGCNLLSIYSKNYIDSPPEKKADKLLHNTKTIRLLGKLLDEGGKCIYVAPSGGRDRPDETGKVQPAPFDSHSVELFRLLGNHCLQFTHFYPLALATYSLFPPPPTRHTGLGEPRLGKCVPVFLAFGKELQLEKKRHPEEEKEVQRERLALFVWNQVLEEYKKLPS